MSEVWHAELLADNIHVSVLCPGFVKTRINLSHRNKQAQYASDHKNKDQDKRAGDQMQGIIDAGASPTLIAERVVEAISKQELYIITHPNFRPGIKARFNAIDDAFERASASPLLADILNEKIPDLG
jgi:short-subunit dehydrogenase